jgi:hypothetical protein
LNRCGQFFRIHATEDAGKVFLASFYMMGDTTQWFALLQKNQGTPTWDEFERLVNQRFGPPIRSNALGELIQLRCETIVADYQTRFLALVNRCKGLTEPHQIDIFPVGLRDPLKTDVELEQPTTLEEAMALARAYEHRMAMSAEPTTCLASRPVYGHTKQLAIPAPSSAAGSQTSGSATTTTEPCFKRLMAAKMAAKPVWGECYNCTKKFSKEHLEVCPVKGIFLLELDTPEPLEQLDDTSPLISLHAITGIATAETIKLWVTIASAPITALVDSSSTHSFISTEAACHLHLEPLFRPGLQVTVANGDRVANGGVYPNIKFLIDSEEFVLDLFVIPLAGYEMVLRVQWLHTLGPILWDFTHARMSCWHDDHRVEWRGVPTPSTHAAINTVVTTDLMSTLLHDFEDVFTIPTGLPPPRRLNHRIHLQPGTMPIVVRPYRYPQLVKDELERQCHNMIKQGIIHHSTSAYSSPVLLVKKQDGSWLFCVDYRTLNAKMIRDMFPIPMVDELLDELCGTRFFSKFDLRNGYHQVRMEPADVEKTAFRMHHNHFEFLVMPFGLTNAPATFQALMNDILHDFIRVFVLVFFEDILIFSDSWSVHLQTFAPSWAVSGNIAWR